MEECRDGRLLVAVPVWEGNYGGSMEGRREGGRGEEEGIIYKGRRTSGREIRKIEQGRERKKKKKREEEETLRKEKTIEGVKER